MDKGMERQEAGFRGRMYALGYIQALIDSVLKRR
jgi:hypothetical protein